MRWRQQKKEERSSEWLDRVWPSPTSPRLRPGRKARVVSDQGLNTSEPKRDPTAGSPGLTGTGEGLEPLRNAVLRLRRGRLKASEGSKEPPAQPAGQNRPSQLTLLEWRRGGPNTSPQPSPARLVRPWWARTNWALGFSVVAMAVAAVMILPELVASARDGMSALQGATDAPRNRVVDGSAVPPTEPVETVAKPVEVAVVPAAVEEVQPEEAEEAVPETAIAEAPGPSPEEEADLALAAASAAAVASLGRKSGEAVPLLLAETHPDLALTARSALVANSGELYAFNSGAPRPIAGLTKLMAAMVYLDTKPDLSSVIRIHSSDVTLGGGSARLAPGWRYTARDLVVSILVGSDNVGVEALVRSTDVGRDEFLIRMAEKALLIGMTSSAFYDPTGLDSRNSASASDLKLMLEAASDYPIIRRQSVRREAEVIPVGRTTAVRYRNGHPLLSKAGWRFTIGKAGYTDEAGFCLATTARLAGIGDVEVVILGAASRQGAVRDAEQMLSYIRRTLDAG